MPPDVVQPSLRTVDLVTALRTAKARLLQIHDEHELLEAFVRHAEPLVAHYEGLEVWDAVGPVPSAQDDAEGSADADLIGHEVLVEAAARRKQPPSRTHSSPAPTNVDRVRAIVEIAEDVVRPTEISEGTGLTVKQVCTVLSRMCETGEMTKLARGVYRYNHGQSAPSFWKERKVS